VMNTDTVVAISDRSTDQLNVVFNTPAGRRYLADRRGVPTALLQALDGFGLSSICNVLAAIQVARAHDLGPDDAILTVATDGARMYATELAKAEARDFPAGFDEVAAASAFGEHLLGGGGARLVDLDDHARTRIFNLGYFTWVEQQGVGLPEFVARRDQRFWAGLRDLLPAWDAMIEEFNHRTGVADRR
jgi:cysteine synthase